MVSVHDHKVAPRSLVLCRGSMARVPAAGAAAYQETLPGAVENPDADSGFVQDGIF
ncbi:hypothetical protein [Yinghuangia soli]|uniref:Uncharacterized protein n=1 Tax=Yinghuangia soli TaxID=2908204 RepID=A0AA41PWS3_9ACTN|nr:hypothetical protein [Yinghuangia soli]MCF2527002.1 hypothetical protein [Yinghuangia soli]